MCLNVNKVTGLGLVLTMSKGCYLRTRVITINDICSLDFCGLDGVAPHELNLIYKKKKKTNPIAKKHKRNSPFNLQGDVHICTLLLGTLRKEKFSKSKHKPNAMPRVVSWGNN